MTHSLKYRDQRFIWHPYTQMKGAEHIPIVKGQGAYLYSEEGSRYLDAISSWWVNLQGHAHPYIAQKVSAQLLELEHVIFAGFTHEPAIELAERLLKILPGNQSKIFYSDNGSTAVEVALKMALQRSRQTGQKRSKILAFKNAYHGDTFGAMSVSARSVWTKPFSEQLFEVVFVEVPMVNTLSDIKATIDKIADDAVCFIYEPLVQGAAGMLMHDAALLSEVLDYCKKKQILLIQDEVFTGFGRTGSLFAADYLSVQPDMICLSKGLTGGTLPLGITSCTNEIYDSFYSDDRLEAFYHGHSFTANPLACAASLASLDLLLSDDTLERIKSISRSHLAFIKTVQDHAMVKDARCCGTIAAIELETNGECNYFDEIGKHIYNWFLSRNILVRPLGNVFYFVPPYCITDNELNHLYSQASEFLDGV